jgi:hypothetical protein
VLTNTNEKHRNVGRVNETDKSTDHVANGVALGNDEAIECADSAKGCVEVASLSNRVSAYKSLELLCQ